jgi:hypothetical protein
MAIEVLEPRRLAAAKRSFTTRRLDPAVMSTLIVGTVRPSVGDLVLARVEMLGKHRRIELTDGRRAHLFPGDEIVVCFANRYAPDQYEAVIGDDLSGCHLVAAGGIAARELARHDRMIEPTRITPIGLVGDRDGRRLNVRDFAIARASAPSEMPAILSVGTSMNAGKTLTATSLLHSLARAGYRAAGIKATGTGAGGDLWIMRDAGAHHVIDFTDAGFASTFLAPIDDLETAMVDLVADAAAAGCDVAVVEIADGLQQLETAALMRSARIRSAVSGVLFSAYDSMGAIYGVDTLRATGHDVLALSGRLSQSPLSVREAQEATGLRVYTPGELQEGALLGRIMARRRPAVTAAHAGTTGVPPNAVRPVIRVANGHARAVDGDTPASNGGEAGVPWEREAGVPNGAGTVDRVAHLHDDLDDPLGLAAATLLTMPSEPTAPVEGTPPEPGRSARSPASKRRRARTRRFETMMTALSEGPDADATHARGDGGGPGRSVAVGVEDVVPAVLGLAARHELRRAELRRLGAELRACAHAFMIGRATDRTVAPDGARAEAAIAITALAGRRVAPPAGDIDDDDDNVAEERAVPARITVSDHDDDDDAVEMPLPPRGRPAARRPRAAAGPAKWSDPVE